MKKNYTAITIIICLILISSLVYGVYTLYLSNSVNPSTTPSAVPSLSPSISPSLSPTFSPQTSPTQSPSPTISQSPSTTPTSSTQPTITPSPTNSPIVTPEPTTTPEPNINTTITIEDLNGNQTLTLPFNRIACLNGGLAEIICALGGENKIVARTGDVIFPTTLLDLPSVGEKPTSVTNVEGLLSLEIDLVVSSSALSDDIISLIQSAGIPVIIDNTSNNDRVNKIVTNFGLILGNPEKAAQIVNNTQYYTNLVQQRLENLSEEEKTTFYYEFSRIWYTMTGKTNMGKVLESCGGKNIATNSSLSYTTLSAEIVAESNPDVIIYSLSGSTNFDDYKAIHDEIMSRSILQDVTAIKEGRVHIFYYYLGAGIRYPIGELYFAKWFYPDLFTDIDPGAIHAQLIEQYYGLDLEGTYVYP
ncbi:MAG: ABC transporter substrate-binding protein [Crenarchaeota archaeon]|nr:ABC transporter substrate-binding protein [Thermoproteota archaeon]